MFRLRSSCSHDPLEMNLEDERQQLNHSQEPLAEKYALEDSPCDLDYSFTEDLFTRNKCVVAIVVGTALGVACFVISILIWLQPDHSNWVYKMELPLSAVDWGIEVISLAINFGVTLILEALSYVHATSLRWALYAEGRLEFNTNLRLFTAARKSAPNGWYTNILSALFLILSYVSTSLLFIKDTPVAFSTWHEGQSSNDYNSTKAYANSVALCCLGIGLLGHVAIASWCMWSKRSHIRTWSSNPLNNTVVMLKHTVQHRKDRCMMSVEDQSVRSQPTKPHIQQPSLKKTSKLATRLILFMWIIVVLALGWSIAMAVVSRKYAIEGGGYIKKFSDTFSWKVQPYENLNTYTIEMDPSRYSVSLLHIPLGWQLFCATLFLCLIQGLQTLGLHCAELFVNVTRDEKVWRKTEAHPIRPKALQTLIQNKKEGINLRQNAISAALHSWEYIILFLFKPALHWIMGQSFSLMISSDKPSADSDNINKYSGLVFAMVYPRLSIYTILSIVLTIFITSLAFRKPKGPQPVTWGHIQTLADLIDNWKTDTKGHLWWGDKGVDDQGIRHAGTSDDKEAVRPIEMGASYAGEVDSRRTCLKESQN